MFSIQLVCEGPTDTIVIEAAIAAQLDDFILTQIQPERSLFGGDQGTFGGGWKGVRAWCQQSSEQGGILSSGGLENTDVLIVHVDADVADDREVACVQPCPHPSATTDALRTMILSWLGEDTLPSKTIFCIPSKSTEAWVLAGLFPDDPHVVPCDSSLEDNLCLECQVDPASLLINKKRSGKRLVRRKNGRVRKDTRSYKAIQGILVQEWPQIVAICSEAQRFHDSLGAYLPGTLVP